MICEACKKQEATVDWNCFTPSGSEEHLQLCQACADARMSTEALQKIHDAKSRGQKVITGWTSYNPVPDEDGKSSA